MKIKGKNILITGASSGIGKLLAFESARRGANLCIGARRIERLEEIKKEIKEKYGCKVIALRLDVKDKRSVKNFVGAALENMDSIDVVINNAGVGLHAPLEKTEEEDYDYVMNTNVKGAYFILKEVIPVMKQQYHGIIVNISSLAGYVGMPFHSIYSMSKFAIRGLTESLRMELKPYRIKVIGVYPGPISTEFQERTRRIEAETKDERINFYWGKVEEAAVKIMDGIEKEKRDVFIRPLWWFTAAISSRYPSLIEFLYDKFYK